MAIKQINEKIIIAIILGLAIVGFGLIQYQAKIATLREQERIERQAQLERSKNFSLCEDEAWNIYSSHWNAECERFGLEKDCSLPLSLLDRLEESRETMIDNCVKLYGN